MDTLRTSVILVVIDGMGKVCVSNTPGSTFRLFLSAFPVFRTGRHRLQGEIRIVLPLTIYSGRGKWCAQASATAKVLSNVIFEKDIDTKK